MREKFLPCLLGLTLAVTSAVPSVAQQPKDPLTRFLDGIFKPEANRSAPPTAQPSVQPERPTPRVTAPAPTRARPAPKPRTAATPRQQPRTARPAGPEKPVATQPPAPAPTAEPRPSDAGQPKENANAAPARPETPEPGSAAAPPAPAANAQPAVNATPVRAPAPAPRPIPSTPAAALEWANGYFNSIEQLTARFVQTSTNGSRAEGTLSVRRPGQLHFAYAPPSTLEIVSDGRAVAVRDKKLGTNDVYSIRQTPLKFLVQEQVDLAKDTKVQDVQVGRDGTITVRFEDSATLGGTSKITLRFDARANALKQWTVLDAQGYETTVVLSGLNVVRRPGAEASN